MINNLTERDILDYLMTSEFEEGLTPDEFKFLLFKFRNFYRITNGKSDTLKADLELKKKDLDDLRNENGSRFTGLQQENSSLKYELNFIKNRKLSWKERLKGKIITEENETK
jgi:hypothetical protein